MKIKKGEIIVVVSIIVVLIAFGLLYKYLTSASSSALNLPTYQSYCPPFNEIHNSQDPNKITLWATLTRMDNTYWSFSLGPDRSAITTSIPGYKFYSYQNSGTFAVGDCVELQYNENTSDIFSLKVLPKSK